MLFQKLHDIALDIANFKGRIDNFRDKAAGNLPPSFQLLMKAQRDSGKLILNLRNIIGRTAAHITDIAFKKIHRLRCIAAVQSLIKGCFQISGRERSPGESGSALAAPPPAAIRLVAASPAAPTEPDRFPAADDRLLQAFLFQAKDGEVSAVMVSNKQGLSFYEARVFIDCTGDADLAVRAGAEYETGNAHGLVQPSTHCFTLANVDTYAYEHIVWERMHDHKTPGYSISIQLKDDPELDLIVDRNFDCV